MGYLVDIQPHPLEKEKLSQCLFKIIQNDKFLNVTKPDSHNFKLNIFMYFISKLWFYCIPISRTKMILTSFFALLSNYKIIETL